MHSTTGLATLVALNSLINPSLARPLTERILGLSGLINPIVDKIAPATPTATARTGKNNLALGLGLNLGGGGGGGEQQAPSKKGGDGGWKCDYDGPSGHGVDPSLDLPGLVSGLCAKVGYSHSGCESFKPRTKPTASPARGIPTHKNTIPTGTIKANSIPTHASGPNPKNCDFPLTYNKALNACVSVGHHCGKTQKYSGLVSTCVESDLLWGPINGKCKGGELDSGLGLCLDVNGFNSGKPTKSGKPDDNGRVGSKSIGGDNSGDDNKHHCPEHQKYSSILGSCTDLSHFLQPKNGGGCNSNYKLDPVAKLCLDLSNFSKPKPSGNSGSDPKSHGQSAIDKGTKVHDCPGSKQFSSLVSACVDVDLLSSPNGDKKCDVGAKLDPLLSLCVDLDLFNDPSSSSSNNKNGNQDGRVGAKSVDTPNNGKGPKNTAAGHVCADNQKWSSVLSACVDVDLLSKPKQGGACPNGAQLDSLLSLCLDLSLLGGNGANPSPASPNKDKPVGAKSILDNNKDNNNNNGHKSGSFCKDGMMWSSIVSACVEKKMLSNPVDGGSGCHSNCQFDGLLNLCLDLSLFGKATANAKVARGEDEHHCGDDAYWDGDICVELHLGSHSEQKYHDVVECAKSGGICANVDADVLGLHATADVEINLV